MAFKVPITPAKPAAPRRPLTPRPTEKTLFEQLLPCSWRDIQFPISSIEVSFQHDLAEHKYWGVDGASVEATGLAPMMIKAVIPFVNGIVPGKGEKWEILYPTAFRTFLRAFALRDTGFLQHPELGEITCKPHSMQFSLDAQRRDGVEVTAEWIETLTEGYDDQLLQIGTSPVLEAGMAADDLDATTDDLRGLADDYLPEQFPESFSSLVNKITGKVDSITTSIKLAANKPAQMLYRVQQLENSLSRNPLTWPISEACARMNAAILDLPKAGRRKIARYTTVGRSTLAGLLCAIPGATADDLIRLNPALVSSPEIGPGVVVRYYAA